MSGNKIDILGGEATVEENKFDVLQFRMTKFSQYYDATFLLSELIDVHECHQSNWFHLLIRALAEFYSIWSSKESG